MAVWKAYSIWNSSWVPWPMDSGNYCSPAVLFLAGSAVSSVLSRLASTRSGMSIEAMVLGGALQVAAQAGRYSILVQQPTDGHRMPSRLMWRAAPEKW